jgi:hypothetical protein
MKNGTKLKIHMAKSRFNLPKTKSQILKKLIMKFQTLQLDRRMVEMKLEKLISQIEKDMCKKRSLCE